MVEPLLGHMLPTVTEGSGPVGRLVETWQVGASRGNNSSLPWRAVEYDFHRAGRAVVGVVFSGLLRGSRTWWRDICSHLITPNAAAVYAALWLPPHGVAGAAVFADTLSLAKLRLLEHINASALVPRHCHEALGDGTAAYGTSVLPQYYALARAFEMVRDAPHELLVRARTDVTYGVPLVLKPPSAVHAIQLQASPYERSAVDLREYGGSVGCGRMPQDSFAYGPREAMLAYAELYNEVAATLAFMRNDSGYRDWRALARARDLLMADGRPSSRPSLRTPGTFLNNNEAFLGHHLRRRGLRCELLPSRGRHAIVMQLRRDHVG